MRMKLALPTDLTVMYQVAGSIRTNKQIEANYVVIIYIHVTTSLNTYSPKWLTFIIFHFRICIHFLFLLSYQIDAFFFSFHFNKNFYLKFPTLGRSTFGDHITYRVQTQLWCFILFFLSFFSSSSIIFHAYFIRKWFILFYISLVLLAKWISQLYQKYVAICCCRYFCFVVDKYFIIKMHFKNLKTTDHNYSIQKEKKNKTAHNILKQNDKHDIINRLLRVN